MVDEVLGVRPHQDRQHEAGDRAEHRRPHPAEHGVEEEHHWRGSPAERAAQSMDAVGAAEPAVLHRRIQQREVGGMEDAVAGAGDHRDGGEGPERVGERHHREREPDGQKPAGQDRPRAEPVDGEAGRRLRHARDAVENAAHQADVGEGEPRLLAHDQQHRHECELVVVAGAVRYADQADDADIAGRHVGEDSRSAPRLLADLRTGAMHSESCRTADRQVRIMR